MSKNLAISAVATAPSPASSGTSLVVTAGHGARFSTSGRIVIWPTASNPDPTNAEICTFTRSTDTFTIVRAQESTSARTVIVGDQVAEVVTAAMWDERGGTIPASFDGQGAVVSSGALIRKPVRVTRTISAATLVADQSGSVTVTVKRYTPSAGALGSATTLGTVALSSAQHTRDTTLSGWTKTLTAGDVIEFSLGGTITSITQLAIEIEMIPNG